MEFQESHKYCRCARPNTCGKNWLQLTVTKNLHHPMGAFPTPRRRERLFRIISRLVQHSRVPIQERWDAGTNLALEGVLLERLERTVNVKVRKTVPQRS